MKMVLSQRQKEELCVIKKIFKYLETIGFLQAQFCLTGIEQLLTTYSPAAM
jgi:hypothetical protein